MLERASACLEPAANNFLRGIESPARSRRILPQRFWRHTGDSTGHASWWPAYLDDVRRAAEARQKTERCLSTRALALTPHDCPSTLLSSEPSALVYIESPAIVALTYRTVSVSGHNTSKNARRVQRRGITSSVPDRFSYQDAQPGIAPDAETPFYLAEYATSTYQGLKGSEPVTSKPLGTMTMSQRLNALLLEPGEHNERVWRLYISLEDQSHFSRPVLHYLSQAQDPMFLRRALQAYHSVETDERISLTYKSAMIAAVGTASYSLAEQIHHEAIRHGRGRESSQVLVGHLVARNLWKRLADAIGIIIRSLRVDDVSEKNSTIPVDSMKGFRQILNEQDLWKAVEKTTWLPEKLVALCNRLLKNDATISSNRQIIERLAMQILAGILENPEVMTVITAEGILRLFSAFKELGLLKVQYFLTALKTLHSMKQTRNRSRLAVLIYRNTRLHHPEALLPKYVYGTLISMCADDGHPPATFEFLLGEFSVVHGQPDLNAYFKAMTACARLGYAPYVERLFFRMCKHHGTPTDISYFTPLLYAYARVGDVKNTKRWFNRTFADFGLLPNTYCWNILLLSYGRAGQDEEALRLFTEMRIQKIEPDAHTLGTLMGICSNAGNTQALHELVTIARELNIQGTTPMIDTLVHSYCLNGEITEAQGLVESVTKMGLPGTVTRMWNILLRHYAFEGNPDPVVKTQARMRELGVVPDGMTYAALMTALVVMGKTETASKILRSLHFNQTLTADLFHYSIILHGYVQEGERDLANVIYSEMVERFPRSSPSARLAMLRLQSKRDSDIMKHSQAAPLKAGTHPSRSYTVDFMADLLTDIVPADFASNDPQPGFRRRKPTEAVPSIYVEFVVSVLNSNASFQKAEYLLKQYLELIEASSSNLKEKTEQSLQLLSARLVGYVRQQMWQQANEIWEQIFQKAVQAGRARPLSLSHQNDHEQQARSSVYAYLTTDAIASVDALNRTRETTTGPSNKTKPLADAPFRILRARRHILSLPLSWYMRALYAQHEPSKVQSLIENLERIGFELTGKNWNTYIQLLASHSNEELQIRAFTLFEEKLFSDSLSWNLLRRGKMRESPPDSTESDLVSYQPQGGHVEKIRPDKLHPTYFTMVHLAKAFLSLHGNTDRPGGSSILKLRRVAAGTVNLVQRIPYLRDRIQGVLLRGRNIKGDPMTWPKEVQETDRAGLRGSRIPLDHVPVAHFDDVQSLIVPGSELTRSRMLEIAQNIDGQVVRTPTIKRSMNNETEQEYTHRITRQEKKKLAILRNIRAEAKAREKLPIMVADPLMGEPHIEALSIPENRQVVAGLPRLGRVRLLAEQKDYDSPIRRVESSSVHRLKRRLRWHEGLKLKCTNPLNRHTRAIMRLNHFIEAWTPRNVTGSSVQLPFNMKMLTALVPLRLPNRRSRLGFTIRRRNEIERKKREKEEMRNRAKVDRTQEKEQKRKKAEAVIKRRDTAKNKDDEELTAMQGRERESFGEDERAARDEIREIALTGYLATFAVTGEALYYTFWRGVF